MTDAVVLLSGGLDSATTLAVARAEGRQCHAMAFAYGQRHELEIRRAQQIADQLGAKSFRIMPLPLARLGGSALTDPSLAVPKNTDSPPGSGPIPATYVPARNTIFLAHALALAEVMGAEEIWLGINSVDYSGYPDCRPAFVEAFERLAQLATAAGVEGRACFRIRAPLLHLAKKEIIQLGLSLGVDYGLTLSCYDPDSQGRSCAQCDACRLRLAGFAALGANDPARYQ